jgi:hypothetical protein
MAIFLIKENLSTYFYYRYDPTLTDQGEAWFLLVSPASLTLFQILVNISTSGTALFDKAAPEIR